MYNITDLNLQIASKHPVSIYLSIYLSIYISRYSTGQASTGSPGQRRISAASHGSGGERRVSGASSGGHTPHPATTSNTMANTSD